MEKRSNTLLAASLRWAMMAPAPALIMALEGEIREFSFKSRV